jgi:formylglycine-generating enzyme required for sulfatase activity
VARIFISYRRDDSGGWAGRLYDRLSEHFGRENVFMDIDTIEPGLDFMEVIEQAVGSCDALVALIGKQWLTITDAAGRRRLDNPEDFVRLEVAAALGRNIRVIPALIYGAPMPRTADLPDVLKPLARRNAHELSDKRFHYDVNQLIEVLDKVLGAAKPSVEETGEERNTSRLPFEPEMILIPAGEFLMGSDPQQDRNAEGDEESQHCLYLPEFLLAKTPVTNAQYRSFVQATGRRAPPHGKEDHPVVDVFWYDARDYCQWLSEVTGRDYRLPSEAEWEKGTRSTDGRLYPWGNSFDSRRCNSKESRQGNTTPVGAYPQGASPYGVLDMAGNVWEWTRSLSGWYPYPSDAKERARREDLQAPDAQARMLRGGAFDSNRGLVRCACRLISRPSESGGVIGFRVALPAS